MNASTPSDHESSHLDHQQAASNIPAIGFAIITLSDTRTEATDKSASRAWQVAEPFIERVDHSCRHAGAEHHLAHQDEQRYRQ